MSISRVPLVAMALTVISSGPVAADGLTTAMDRLTCTGEAATASAGMIVRQMDNPRNLAIAQQETRNNGIIKEGIHLTSSFYVELAYDYPIAADRRAQQEAFSEAAMTACLQRLQESR